MRYFTLLDKIISEADVMLQTLLPPQKRECERSSPAQSLEESHLKNQEKKHISGLMRVNHSGEVCAQALYQGQALTAENPKIQKQMSHAAAEEIDHLAWCEERLQQLGSHPSFLNPFWYLGSFILGSLAGLAGDRISLGFVAETERQVSLHLEKHLNLITHKDLKSHSILQQMQIDETQHAQKALHAGAIELPIPIKKIMTLMAKVMTTSSYYL